MELKMNSVNIHLYIAYILMKFQGSTIQSSV